MTFADDFVEYSRWKSVAVDSSPAAWEAHKALVQDAMYLRENREDIEEALSYLYWIRNYSNTRRGNVDEEVFGRDLWAEIGGAVTSWTLEDD